MEGAGHGQRGRNNGWLVFGAEGGHGREIMAVVRAARAARAARGARARHTATWRNTVARYVERRRGSATCES